MTRRSIAARTVSILFVGLWIDTAIAQSIEGTAWDAIELYGIPVAGPFTTTDRQPHLVFSANGRLSGSDGCNELTGPYTVKAVASPSDRSPGRRWLV